MNNKRLYKNSDNASIAGVCSGLAEYLNMDVSTVRILTVLIVLFTGVGVIPYIILAIVLPDKKDVIRQEEDRPVYKVPKQDKDDDLYEYDEDEYKL